MVSKLKAVDPKKAEPTKPKILIFGKPGVGKTYTSLDFPGVYYLDVEGGASRDHYTDKLKASGGVYFGPEQGSQDFKTVIDEIQALATEKHSFKTLVIDSVSKLYNTEIAKEQERMQKVNREDSFGASKKPATMMARRLISWIDKIQMNVIMIAHEKAMWSGGEQAGETFDFYEKAEYELDLCLQIIKQGNGRKAKVKKSRLIGFPDGLVFDWSYEGFAEKYGKEVIESQGEAIQLVTQDQLVRYKTLMELWKAPDGQEEKWLSAAKAESLQELDTQKMSKIISYIEEKIKGST